MNIVVWWCHVAYEDQAFTSRFRHEKDADEWRQKVMQSSVWRLK